MRVPGKKDLIQLGDHKNLSLSSHPFFPLTFEIPPLYSHHHFRGIKLLERKTLGVSNPPRANVLLLDKNEPMICDNSLDLLLENDPKKIIAVPNQLSWGSLYSPVRCNYKLLCLWLSIHRFFWTESEYAQEMVEMSFWESKKFPRHIPKHFHFQQYKLWDIYKISCIPLYADTIMYICRYTIYNSWSDQAKFVQNSYESLNPFFLCSSEKQKYIKQMSRVHFKENITIYVSIIHI